jgi:mono/diheme cytochrome c family protein
MATIVFVLFWVLLGIGVVMAAMRSGRRTPLINSATRGGRRTARLLAVATAVLFVVAIPIAVGLSGDDPAQAGSVRLSEAEQQGRRPSTSNCGQCHTLGAANAVGRVGPDLDELRPARRSSSSTRSTRAARAAWARCPPRSSRARRPRKSRPSSPRPPAADAASHRRFRLCRRMRRVCITSTTLQDFRSLLHCGTSDR